MYANRCRYCQNFFCCDAHRTDHEVKHHMASTNRPLFVKNKKMTAQLLATKNVSDIIYNTNKQQYSNRKQKHNIIETIEVKAENLSRKRPHSCVKAKNSAVSQTVILKPLAFPQRKILKPTYKNVKVFDNENNLNVLESQLKGIIQTDNSVTKSMMKVDLPCAILSKKPDTVNKKLDGLDSSKYKVLNEIKEDNLLASTNGTYKVPLAVCASNDSQQDIVEEVFTQCIDVQRVLSTDIYEDATDQTIMNGTIKSPPIDLNKEATITLFSPVSDGGTPPGKTSTPVTGDEEELCLKINDNWCTAIQNLSLSIYRTPVEEYSGTVAGSLMSPTKTAVNQVKCNPSATPLCGIMKKSKHISPGNETLNSTSSLSKLRHVTFSQSEDVCLTQSELSYDTHKQQSTASDDNPEISGNSILKTMANFVTSAFQSLPGFISSNKNSNSDVTLEVPKTAKRIRSPDIESSREYSPSHKRRCYHCYMKENPIKKRRSISEKLDGLHPNK